NKSSFKVMSLPNSVNQGETSCAIFCISSLVSAEFKLKKILDKRSKFCPANSKASIVFSKVGISVELTITSISPFALAIQSLKDEEKSDKFICEKGAD